MTKTSRYFTYFLFVALAFTLADFSTSAAPFVETEARKGIVKVVFYREGEEKTAAGFVVAKDYVITIYGLAEWAERINVVNVATGAEIVATKENLNSNLGITLLKVKGLAIKPLPLSESEKYLNLPEERHLYVVSPHKKSGSKIGFIFSKQSPFIRHNAVIQKEAFGSPVFNRCGQIVAVNRPENNSTPGFFGDWTFPDNPEKEVFAVQAKSVIEFLKTSFEGKGISINTTKAVCLTAQQEANKGKKKSEGEKREANKKAAEEAEKRAEAEAEAGRQAAEAEATMIGALKARRVFLFAAGIAGIIILLASGFVWYRMRRKSLAVRQAQEGARLAALPPLGARDLLLEGEARDRHHAVKIPAMALKIEQGGAVIGRNPSQSSFVIDQEDISREHIRFFVNEGQIMIEDLGSTNGTFLNGEMLLPNQAVALNQNDHIKIASFDFTIKFL